MQDCDASLSKMTGSAQRVVDRAISISRRHRHGILTNEHILLAFAVVEWQTFSRLMGDVGILPQELVRDVRERLNAIPPRGEPEMKVSPATKLLFKLAFHHAARAGRQTIESIDLFSAIFEESGGIPASIIRAHGVAPERLLSRIATSMREMERRAEHRLTARETTSERVIAPPTAPLAEGLFDDATRRWAAEEADKARAWPDPPRTFRRRLFDLMGLRARRKA